MRILITGSRDWTDHKAIENALLQATAAAFAHREPITIIHGACPTGADEIAGRLAFYHGWIEERWPADWHRYHKGAGPRRNQEMVTMGADLCLAFPLGESRGTRDCIRRAKQAHIPVVIHGLTRTNS